MRSIKTHLTVTLLLCILLPTGLIGATAYWFAFNCIKENRIEDVGQIAEVRYETMRMQLHKDNERGKVLLDTLIASCRYSDEGINACARGKLGQFAAINDTVGFSLHSGIENDLEVGSDAIPLDKLNKPFLPDQIAATSSSNVNGAPLFSLIAADPASGMSLVTTYSGQKLQDIFDVSPTLGQSGETFLADNQGFFITKPRYSSQQGVSEPISAVPMQHCLHKESGKILGLDYRNVSIIHGFRFVPEIGGGCIMVHVDQAEAFAPLNRLIIGLCVAAILLICFAWLIALKISKGMTKPIVALADMAQALSRGDFTQQVSPTGYHEITEFSQLFNNMSRQLDSTLNRLKASEYELEKKVIKRTAELHERHRRYHSVIQNTGEGFWRVDKEGRLLEANPAYARLSGYSETELAGMQISNLEALETPEETADHVRNVMQNGSDSFETQHRRKDGSVWDVEVNASFIDEEGSEYFVGFFRDITERKQTERLLKDSKAYQHAIFNASPDAMLISNEQGRITMVNQQAECLLGYSDNELIELSIEALVPERFRAAHPEHRAQFAATSTSQPTRIGRAVKALHKDGSELDVEVSLSLIQTAQGSFFASALRDITDRKQMELDLQIAATAFESQDAIVITDTENIILRINKAFTESTGYTEKEAVGQKISILKSGRHDAAFYEAMWKTIMDIGAWQGEVWDRRKNGEIYPKWLSITAVKDSDGIITRYVGTHTDITERKNAEEQIRHLAFYDPLTGLPNRRLLQERLKHGINVERRDGRQMGLLMLDLDRFKAVNDSLGHLAGDELLQQVAERITARLRDVDMVARLGGDEFIVLLEDIMQPEDAARVAEEIITDLTRPFCLTLSDNVQIGASIGISLYPQHGDNPELLMNHADDALYQAKDAGRGCFAYFSENLTLVARERIALESRLRRAVEQQELRIFYQPQVDIASGRIVGAEALVRWQDPVNGLVQPLSFIPIAEESSLIVEIGGWVLRETCRQGRQWLDEGLPPFTLAVNVSPHQFRRGDICGLVATVLSETGFPPEQLELEITESGLMENQENAAAILNNLRAQGVRLAIDDFGTGYSSLGYLKNFPLDVLKIDK
ncbi:MAG TPA: PAS domain S-box protein, partial [Methylobacter sp.]